MDCSSLKSESDSRKFGPLGQHVFWLDAAMPNFPPKRACVIFQCLQHGRSFWLFFNSFWECERGWIWLGRLRESEEAEKTSDTSGDESDRAEAQKTSDTDEPDKEESEKTSNIGGDESEEAEKTTDMCSDVEKTVVF